MCRRDAASTQVLRIQLLKTPKDSTILPHNKYINITQIFNICPTVLPAHMPKQLHLKLKENQAYSGIPLSGWPPWKFLPNTDWIVLQYNQLWLPSQVHLDEWLANKISLTRVMTHVLSGDCGDIYFKGLGYFTKFPRQWERLIFVPFRDIHNLGYFLGSIPDFS